MSEFESGLEKITTRAVEPKPFTAIEYEVSEESFPDLYPIYFVRILDVLVERDKKEKEYQNNPQIFQGLTDKVTYSYSYLDLADHGIRITELKLELAKKVRNQNLKPGDFKPLLEKMMNPDIPYVLCKSDEKNSNRYFVTQLGKEFYKKTKDDDALCGYWEIVAKTQLPYKKILKRGKKPRRLRS